jgi:hypothetical protein
VDVLPLLSEDLCAPFVVVVFFLQETTVKGCNRAAQRHITRVEIVNELTEDMNEIQYRGKVFKKEKLYYS